MKKKPSFYNIVIAVILALIILIGALVLFVNPEQKKVRKPVAVMNETPVTPPKPVFRKDGELRFIDNKTSKVISAIDIEVADNDPEREQGLMYRDSMAENQGMLFLMGREEIQTFWMKNTIMSLDIIYADASQHIVSIHTKCTPYSLDPIPSAKPASYVVEVNTGYAARHEIKVGDRISF